MSLASRLLTIVGFGCRVYFGILGQGGGLAAAHRCRVVCGTSAKPPVVWRRSPQRGARGDRGAAPPRKCGGAGGGYNFRAVWRRFFYANSPATALLRARREWGDGATHNPNSTKRGGSRRRPRRISGKMRAAALKRRSRVVCGTSASSPPTRGARVGATAASDRSASDPAGQARAGKAKGVKRARAGVRAA